MVYNILFSSYLFIWFLLSSHVTVSSTSLDSLAGNQSIRDGETLVSEGGTFEVGFFSPGSSTGRYLGVWYRNISPLKAVWVANRETPLHNNSGVLKLNQSGVLVILNSTNSSVWYSNISSQAVSNPIAQLLDSGNLVVKNGQGADEDNFLWQSFDYPGDTLLSGMKLGWNLETGLQRFLSSWKSADDPAKGDYSVKLDLRGYPQLFRFKGSAIEYRLGSWNGLTITGYANHQVETKVRYEFVLNEKQVYFEIDFIDRSTFTMYTLTPSGVEQKLVWTSQTSRQVITFGGVEPCENYALCGANSICKMDDKNFPSCECLKAYVPKFPEQWTKSNWSNGCVPRTKSSCRNNNTDGFWKYSGLKIPDTSWSWYSKTMNIDECQKLCLKNCSCTSFANLDISKGGSGCLLWFHNLIDTMQSSHVGQDLYIRVPASELEVHVAVNGHGHKKKKLVGITVSVIIFGLTTCFIIIILRRRGVPSKIFGKHFKDRLRKEDIDLPTLDLAIITKATENFSSSNKLGEGGFGPVYKGKLNDEQLIAVKRLSKKSGQGIEEFKNEVVLIAKLQHRNLVKLLACCIQGEERMLIYEYMPNKSLDYFIFDETKRKVLDWPKRLNIISGIARGLLYLHQDSRLRIIHRDLKTSNVLLDANLDPKISDFGLARTFLGDQVEANTNRVVGTYGYMPPEYAVHGHFSMKSDVFSYGVIILEIVSGKKNRGFSDPEHYRNLLGHAWRLWAEERALELLDEVFGEQCTLSEVMRCIQVGLLCVQQRPEDRPDMSSVVLMLNGEKLLPQPKAPGFYIENNVTPEVHSLSVNRKLCSANEISISVLDGR
ncbi:G-type lectin S-receptor-like serine/threonine-protein kinase At4g27290 [Gastrolobium bilobum]|uniref:G-type lectin S-receptor-like serine/threonine-protein kinase At4g27290 n=1 Tax=Gastrolobium bilobum TaxID=150636 RepID=UPI002AAF49D4|nr:G-type lectin S-receptor-like serine/threonine-protein kinase At4g27290 [Gastrolobium bilobum]